MEELGGEWVGRESGEIGEISELSLEIGELGSDHRPFPFKTGYVRDLFPCGGYKLVQMEKTVFRNFHGGLSSELGFWTLE